MSRVCIVLYIEQPWKERYCEGFAVAVAERILQGSVNSWCFVNKLVYL